MFGNALTNYIGADGVLIGREVVSPGWVAVSGGVIVEVGGGDAPQPTERYGGVLTPGFADMHAHGALGHDFGTADTDGIRAAIGYHTRRGTTRITASVASAPLEVLEERISTLGRLVTTGEIAGIHLEGPYLSPHRRGAHALDLLRQPDVAEVEQLLTVAPGAIRMVTIAPELPGAEDVIRLLVSQQIAVALGHTSCTARQAREAFGWGATILTHAYNGMPPLHHREAGPLGAALVDGRVTIELILDGHHVGAEAAEIAWRAVGSRLALISDAMEATGLGDGHYRIAGSAVIVRDGVAKLADRSSLAGSTITAADGLRRLHHDHAVPLPDAVAAVTSAPARALGYPEPRIAVGSAADLVLLGDTTRIAGVMRNGQWVVQPAG